MIKRGPRARGCIPGVGAVRVDRPIRRIIGKLCNAVWASLTSLLCVKRLVVEAFSGSVSQSR